MYPTVEEALALPVIRRGRPTLVAGAGGLHRGVRWVHAAEVADIAHLLRGGELVLTTGIALPDDPAALRRYVAELASVGAAGLVVELVRHWRDRIPEPLRAAADEYDLPLVTLAAETRFVAVTEAVAGLIVAAQVAELRAAEHVHETFTELTVSCAEPAEVLREVARTAGTPVVLENLAHQVLAYDAAGAEPADLLADWQVRSRAIVPAERTGYQEDAGWLVTAVGARGQDWGRLVLVCPRRPTHRQVVVAERAASALAVQRLVSRDRDSLERQTHRTLLTELLSGRVPAADLATRATALGVPLADRVLIGLAVRLCPSPRERPTSRINPQPEEPDAGRSGAGTSSTAASLSSQEVLRDVAEATALAAARAGIPALVGVVDDTSVRGLLALPRDAEIDAALGTLARQVHHAVAGAPRTPPVVVAVGSTVYTVPEAARSLVEAAHVAGAVRDAAGRPYHRLDDVRLRGLLHLLRDDERVTAFVQRELGPLLAAGAAGARHLDLLRCHCRHGGNKSAAAAAAHLSRTAYYQQLARIEKILGVRLDDPESVLSLHVALLAMDSGPGA